jgi:hypothetical protein
LPALFLLDGSGERLDTAVIARETRRGQQFRFVADIESASNGVAIATTVRVSDIASLLVLWTSISVGVRHIAGANRAAVRRATPRGVDRHCATALSLSPPNSNRIA